MNLVIQCGKRYDKRTTIAHRLLHFIDTLCEGSIPAWRDEKGNCVVYETELEAQREIADDVMERLRQFLAGERDFEDAMAVEDYIVPVTVQGDGTVTDLSGNIFRPKMG